MTFGGFDFLPNSWGEFEREIYHETFDPVGAYQDLTAQTLFNEAYFNFDLSTDEKNAIRDALDQYMDSVYDYDFQANFDWVAYREAYDGEG